MESARKAVRPMTLDNAPMLPGHYECLTTQLNITTHRAGQVGRFVLVTRLPQESLELKRSFSAGQDWMKAYTEAMRELTEHLAETRYLMGWTTAR